MPLFLPPLNPVVFFPFQIFRRADKNGECFVLPPPPPRSLARGEAAALPRREARCKSKGRGQAALCLEEKRLSALPAGGNTGRGLGGGSPASPPVCHGGQSLPVLGAARWGQQREGGQSRLCSTTGWALAGFFSTPCRTVLVSAPCLGDPLESLVSESWALLYLTPGNRQVQHHKAFL